MQSTTPRRWPPRARARCVLALSASVLAAGCGDERETLLQLDVVIPAGVHASKVEVAVGGELPGQQRRSYAGPEVESAGTVGLDVRLPRALTGAQPVDVRAVDTSGCVLAQRRTTVELAPGTIVAGGLVALEATAPGACAATDAGASDARDGSADGAEVAPTHDGGSDEGATGDGAAPSSDDGAAPGDGPAPAIDALEIDAPAGPRSCTSLDQCAADENCLAGICREAPVDCAAIAAAMPNAADGVYRLDAGGAVGLAYCDMRLKRVLCAQKAGEHAGRTRDGADLPFLLSSVLESGDVCRIWAVRHQTGGQPFDLLTGLDTAPGALVKSTCEAFGFKGDVDIRRQCYYGSLQHCGFDVPIVTTPTGRVVAKWGNTCDCNPNRGRPFYSLEDKIQVASLPWSFDGGNAGTCKTR
jgi:hypothetical protein